MSEPTPREAADYVDDFYRRFDDTAGHALDVLIDHARREDVGATARLDTATVLQASTLRGRDDICEALGLPREAPTADALRAIHALRPAGLTAEDGLDAWPMQRDRVEQHDAPPAAASERPDRTARSLSLAGDFPNDGRVKVFVRVGHLTERRVGTVDRDELTWEPGRTLAAFLRAVADEYENGAPLEPGETS